MKGGINEKQKNIYIKLNNIGEQSIFHHYTNSLFSRTLILYLIVIFHDCGYPNTSDPLTDQVGAAPH